VLGVVSAGGVVGALGRFLVGEALPRPPTGFPWATFVVNVSGCLLIGALMVLVAELWPARHMLRAFLGTGLLGGYTTFSTYVLDVHQLLGAGAAGTALTYLGGTLLAALAAVYVGTTVARLAIERGRRGAT
jgi:fluoride exporter